MKTHADWSTTTHVHDKTRGKKSQQNPPPQIVEMMIIFKNNQRGNETISRKLISYVTQLGEKKDRVVRRAALLKHPTPPTEGRNKNPASSQRYSTTSFHWALCKK